MKPRSHTFSGIARHLKLKLTGDDIDVSGINEPETAGKHEIIFVMRKNVLRKKERIASKAWIIDESIASPAVKEFLKAAKITSCVSKNIHEDFVTVINLFYLEKRIKAGIHKTAVVHPSAIVKKSVRIGAYCVIDSGSVLAKNVHLMAHGVIGKNVRIGKNTKIYPHVTIYDHCEIGNNVIVHSGTVIGSDGFGFYKKENRHFKIPHVGKTVIEDDVEIGANCCIDRGTLGETRIRKGAKLDNLIQIAHNVNIGEHTLIAAQTGIAGSTTIGNSVTIAGQAGLVDHIEIGDGVTIGAQSGVIASVEKGKTVSGYPARDHFESLKKEAFIQKIPEIVKMLAEKKNQK